MNWAMDGLFLMRTLYVSRNVNVNLLFYSRLMCQSLYHIFLNVINAFRDIPVRQRLAWYPGMQCFPIIMPSIIISLFPMRIHRWHHPKMLL